MMDNGMIFFASVLLMMLDILLPIQDIFFGAGSSAVTMGAAIRLSIGLFVVAAKDRLGTAKPWLRGTRHQKSKSIILATTKNSRAFSVFN